MATIIIKNSTGSNSTPASLLQGELAINTVTGKLFYGSGSGNAVREYSASYATTAATSSYPLSVVNTNDIQFGGALYTTAPQVASGVPSGRSASGSIWLGKDAGLNATNAIQSIFIGPGAGNFAFSGSSTVIIGVNAGYSASYANLATFVGSGAGYRMWSGSESTAIGWAAGNEANNANKSVFIGNFAGAYAKNAAKSILIGYQAGYDPLSGTDSIGNNNIVIGSYLTLPSGSQDSINIGGIIFGTGSYSTETVSTGSLTGKIGINVVSPNYTLDVSGSGNYSEGLTVTGSINMIGTGSIELTGSLNLTGSQIISGSLLVNNGTYDIIDTIQYFLKDNNVSNNISIDWNNRILYDTNGNSQLNWNAGIISLPGTTQGPITNILGMDGSGNVYYTASSAIGGGGASFPYTGSAIITGSLVVTGSTEIMGDVTPGGPYTSNTSSYNLGSPTKAWNKLYVGNNSIHIVSGSTSASISFDNGNITFNNANLTVPSGSTVPTASFSTTASYVLQAVSASFATTASFALNAGSTFTSTSSIIGNGSATSFNINHGFNTRNLHITVYESSSNGETVYPDIRRINANTASIIFANPPTSNQYIVYISQ